MASNVQPEDKTLPHTIHLFSMQRSMGRKFCALVPSLDEVRRVCVAARTRHLCRESMSRALEWSYVEYQADIHSGLGG